MVNDCRLYPGLRDGKSYWIIEFNDGSEDVVPFGSTETKTLRQQVKEKCRLYYLRKRTEKINKILNG